MKPVHETYLLGITGMIGSGKSYVCRMFARRGIPVYDTDKAAKLAIATNKELRDKISQLIPGAFDDNGEYNKKMVASVIFSDEDKRVAITDLVGSWIKDDFNIFIDDNSLSRIVCVESAILQSSWLIGMLDGVLVVNAPDDVRLARIIERDGRTAEEAKAIMRVQSDYSAPTFTITNDGPDVEKDVFSIIKTIYQGK